MTDYREILRLRSLGLNHSQITESLGVARQTVITVTQRAMMQELDWQAAESLSDRELAQKLFPSACKADFKIPDYEYVHREMTKPDMTQQLLWFEYCDKCRDAGDIPYGLTQFKKYYREYVAKTKATMHINRKPGEIMEVDWAGQTANLTDSDTGEFIRSVHFRRRAAVQRIRIRRGFLGYETRSLDNGTRQRLQLLRRRNENFSFGQFKDERYQKH